MRKAYFFLFLVFIFSTDASAVDYKYPTVEEMQKSLDESGNNLQYKYDHNGLIFHVHKAVIIIDQDGNLAKLNSFKGAGAQFNNDKSLYVLYCYYNDVVNKNKAWSLAIQHDAEDNPDTTSGRICSLRDSQGNVLKSGTMARPVANCQNVNECFLTCRLPSLQEKARGALPPEQSKELPEHLKN